MLFACGNPDTKIDGEYVGDDVTQVFYFHTKKRCATCNAIEQLTKQVVDSLAQAGIVMRTVDITENESLADKYEISWSSLVLDRGGKIENLTDMAFRYAKNRPQEFKSKLVDALKKIEE